MNNSTQKEKEKTKSKLRTFSLHFWMTKFIIYRAFLSLSHSFDSLKNLYYTWLVCGMDNRRNTVRAWVLSAITTASLNNLAKALPPWEAALARQIFNPDARHPKLVIEILFTGDILKSKSRSRRRILYTFIYVYILGHLWSRYRYLYILLCSFPRNSRQLINPESETLAFRIYHVGRLDW